MGRGEGKGSDPKGLVDTPHVPNPEKYPGERLREKKQEHNIGDRWSIKFTGSRLGVHGEGSKHGTPVVAPFAWSLAAFASINFTAKEFFTQK